MDWKLVAIAALAIVAGALAGFLTIYILASKKQSRPIKLYVDDERPCPEGWVLAQTYTEAQRYLLTSNIEIISLDHDLGGPLTGYDIMCWIEEHKPHLNVVCHSANPVGRARIEQAIEACKRRRTKVE